MSDYHFSIDVLRGSVADQLAENTEQFIFVLTNALVNIDIEAAIAEGQLGDEVENDFDRGQIIISLRDLANAIEEGDIT